MQKAFLIFLTCFLTISCASGQCLSGHYTVGSNGADYLSVQAALGDAKAKGWMDTLFFDVQPGIYLEQITVKNIFNSSPCVPFDLPVIVQKDPDLAGEVAFEWPVEQGENYILKFENTRDVQFRDIRFSRTGGVAGNTQCRVVKSITNSSIYFRNCKFEAPELVLLNVVTETDSIASLIYFSKDITLDSCVLIGGRWGVGSDPNWGDSKLNISGCQFEQQVFGGCFLYYFYGEIDIKGNQFNTGSGADAVAIRVENTSASTQIRQNHIICSGNGIRLSVYSSGNYFTVNNNFLITPNGRPFSFLGGIIANFSWNSIKSKYGIKWHSSATPIVFNTDIMGKYSGGIFGNIFDVSEEPAIDIDLQYIMDNTYFGANCYVPKPNQTTIARVQSPIQNWDFASWVMPTRDKLAVQKAVSFVSETDLHLTAPDEDLNGKVIIGSPFLGFTVNPLYDIDGEQSFPNNPYPDIGADQFYLPVTNAAISNANGPIQRQPCGTVYPVKFRLYNAGEKSFSEAVIRLTVNGVVHPLLNWQGDLAVQKDTLLQLAALPFIKDTIYRIKAEIISIDGKVDVYENSNSDTTLVYSDITGGDFTVGIGGDYPSVEALNNVISVRSFCEPSRILFLSGEYTGGIEISNTSNITEITSYSGNPKDVRWTDARLNFIEVNNLHIHDLSLLSPELSTTMQFIKCQNLVIENIAAPDNVDLNSAYCTIDLLHDTLVEVRNCSFRCVYGNAFSATYSHRLIIDKINVVTSYPWGNSTIFKVWFSDSISVSNSRLSGGVRFSFSNFLKFYQNESTGTNGEQPIHANTCNDLQVFNNFFYCTTSELAFSECLRTLFAHNTVISKSAYSTMVNARLMAINTPSDKMKLLNNIFVAEHPGIETILYLNRSEHFISDHNCFSTVGPAFVTKAEANNTPLDLATWQQTSGQDLNSVIFLPTFLSEENARITGNPVEITGKASFLPGISERDIDDDPRFMGAADIGADQFNGLSTDANILACNLEAETCQATPQIRIKIQNLGPDTLRSAKIEWMLNSSANKRIFHWEGALAAGDSSAWLLLGSQYVWLPDTNDFEVRIIAARDNNPSNDIYSLPNFAHAMKGDYIVNGPNAPFKNLNEALTMLRTAGACASVKLLLYPHHSTDVKAPLVPGLSPEEQIIIEPVDPGLYAGSIRQLGLNKSSQTFFKRLLIDGMLLEEPNSRMHFDSCWFTGEIWDNANGDGPLHFKNCRFQTSIIHLGSSNFFVNDASVYLENCHIGTPNGILKNNAEGIYLSQFGKLVLQDCQFERTSPVFIYRVMDSLLIERNRFLSTKGLSIEGANGTALNPFLVRNNFFYFKENPLDEPKNEHLLRAISSSYLHVFHNSFYVAPENTATGGRSIIGFIDLNHGRFENNICKARGNAHVFDMGFTSLYASNYNFFDVGTNRFSAIHPTLSSWQQTSADSNSILGTVKFVVEQNNNGDLHLATDSPTIPYNDNVIAGLLTDIDSQDRSTLQAILGADTPTDTLLLGYVWPGDTDHDKIVGTSDWLQLGLAMGHNLTGPPRADTSITFIPKYAQDWQGLVQSINAKHADSNGDGILDLSDTMAIVQNFSMQHFLRGGLEDINVTNLQLQMPTGPLTAGVAVEIPVILGASNEALYGLAVDFSFPFDAIVPGSFQVDFQDTWLGNDAIGFYRNNTSNGTYPLALVRTNGQNAIGSGQIALMKFKVGTPDSLRIQIGNVKALLADGSDKPIGAEQVSPVAVGTTDQSRINNLFWEIFPNPVDEQCIIRTGLLGGYHLLVFDALGRVCYQLTITGSSCMLDTQHLPSGIYTIQLSNELGHSQKRMIVSHK